MFWSHVVSNEVSKVEEEFPFFISMAAVELNGNQKPVEVFAVVKGKKTLLCTLTKDCFNQCLNIEVEPCEPISFCTVGRGIVHLSGFSKEDDLDDAFPEESDEESDEVEEEVPQLKKVAATKVIKKDNGVKKNVQVSKKAKFLLDEASEEEEEDDSAMEDDDDDDDEEEEDESEEEQVKVVQNKKHIEEKKLKQKKMILKGNVVAVDVKEGNGKVAKVNNRLSVMYSGRLTSGKLFDSNVGSRPFKFRLGKGEVIKGWDIGMAGMKVGGKRTLVIPSNMAYGNKKIDGIPANSTLLFEVNLVGAN